MKQKPLTEKRIREIVREEIAKIPPTYVPVPYPQPNPTPATPYQPNYPNPYVPPIDHLLSTNLTPTQPR